MWTEERRARHAPRDRRYPSDLTDAEWALIAPFIPPPRSGGRGRKIDMCEVLRGIGLRGFVTRRREATGGALVP